MITAVLGASPNPERYSHRAVALLRETGHAVVPIHPRAEAVAGVPARAQLAAIDEAIDTITLYVGPAHSDALLEGIIAAAPRRLIVNPGAENPGLEQAVRAAGIEVLHACTLVLLSTGRY